MTTTSVARTDWKAAGEQSWITRIARANLPNYDARMQSLIEERACYRMIIADSGVTPNTHSLMARGLAEGKRADVICDEIHEQAPRATALSRCDGSPVEVLDIIDTDAQNRQALGDVNTRIRALKQAHL